MFNIRYNHDVNEPYEPYCIFMQHRFKLAVWILAEINCSGKKAVDRLKAHLGVNTEKVVKSRLQTSDPSAPLPPRNSR